MVVRLMMWPVSMLGMSMGFIIGRLFDKRKSQAIDTGR